MKRCFMKTEKPELKPSRAKTPEELAANFQRQIIERARRALAVRRAFPGGSFIRWKRAAASGPNRASILIFCWAEGQPPRTEVWSTARLDELAGAVTDAELQAELARWLVRSN
jgi:hypothetical protein